VHENRRSAYAQGRDECGNKTRTIADRQDDAVTRYEAKFLTRQPRGQSMAGAPQPGSVKFQSAIQIVKRARVILEEVEQRSRGEIWPFSREI
jgi:hypothetical protein